MTTNKLFTSVLLVAFAALLSTSFTSCKKDDHDDDHSHEGTGHLHVYFQNKMGSMDLMYGHTHELADGRKYNFSAVQYYVSNLRLKKDDGSDYNVEGIYEISIGDNLLELDLEDIPAGHYHGIKFNVGIDSVTNHGDPSVYAAGHPLASQNPSMHWSWNSGYRFLLLEGEVDTLATPSSSSPEYGTFALHLGGDANLMDIDLMKHFEAGESEHPSVTVNMDAEYLLNNSNIDMTDASDRSTHAAVKLKTSLADAFSAQ